MLNYEEELKKFKPALDVDEVETAADLVRGVIDYSANLIFGACIDETMQDTVEVVIIATGFNQQTNGITPEAQDAALRQASLLSRKIDSVYAQKEEPFNATPYMPQQPSVGLQYGTPYIQPQTQPPVQPVPAFEPDDPIPETQIVQNVEQPERKHRHKFVDFFIKRKENKND